jgi:hypothetical protein
MLLVTGDHNVKLVEAKWSIAQALARMSKRDGVDAQIVGIHSVSRQGDNTCSVWLDLDPPHLEWNGMPGILCVYIDEAEVNRTSGPDELLAILSGRNETKH